MNVLLEFVRQNEAFVQIVVGLIASLTVAVWTVQSYFASKRTETAWKRTEFMFDQLRYLDTDERIGEALAVLEGWNKKVTPDDVFSPTSSLPPGDRARLVASFDRLL